MRTWIARGRWYSSDYEQSYENDHPHSMDSLKVLTNI